VIFGTCQQIAGKPVVLLSLKGSFDVASSSTTGIEKQPPRESPRFLVVSNERFVKMH